MYAGLVVGGGAPHTGLTIRCIGVSRWSHPDTAASRGASGSARQNTCLHAALPGQVVDAPGQHGQVFGVLAGHRGQHALAHHLARLDHGRQGAHGRAAFEGQHGHPGYEAPVLEPGQGLEFAAAFQEEDIFAFQGRGALDQGGQAGGVQGLVQLVVLPAAGSSARPRPAGPRAAGCVSGPGPGYPYAPAWGSTRMVWQRCSAKPRDSTSFIDGGVCPP